MIDLDAIRERAENRSLHRHATLAADVLALVGRIQELEADHEVYQRNITDEYQRRIKAEAELASCRTANESFAALALDLQAERDTALDVARQATEDYRREEEAARKYLAERDELREALEAALDCGGPYGGTVSRDHGQRAICSLCEGKARAALTQGAGDE